MSYKCSEVRSRRLLISRYVKSIATQFVSAEMTNIPASEQSHQAMLRGGVRVQSGPAAVSLHEAA